MADEGGGSPFLRHGATYNGSGLRVQKSDTWTGGHYYSWAARGVYYDTNNSTYLGDQKGNTRYLSDINGTAVNQGARYDAYGNKHWVLGRDPQFSDYQHAGAHGYQSEWSSVADPALSMQYLQQRYYDAEAGGSCPRTRSGMRAGSTNTPTARTTP